MSEAFVDRPVAAVLTDTRVTATVRATLNENLHAALSAQLAGAAESAGHPELAVLLRSMPAGDIAGAKDLSLQAFVRRAVGAPTDAAAKASVDAAIEQLSATTTVGDLLGLEQTVNSNAALTAVTARAGLTTLLQTSPALARDPRLVADFVSRYASAPGPAPQLWQSLEQDPALAALVPELQLTLQLGTLTLGNPALVAALRERDPQLTTTRSLATMSAADWKHLIQVATVPVPEGEDASSYAAAIASALHDAFPGTIFGRDLQRALGGSTSRIDRGVTTVLTNVPDLDVIQTNIAQTLAKRGDSAFSGIAATDRAAVTQRLVMWQRVARVSSDFSTASALVDAGYTSAYGIASTPRATFIQAVADRLSGATAASAVYARAQQIAGTAMAMFTNIRQALTSVSPRAIGEMAGPVAQFLGTPQGIPDWTTLFGSLSSCECTDCRSVYSAAAYFVDLLHFLSKSGKNGAGQTPLDALLGRRPDLQYLKLNCVNTNTVLPYVDLVNEILESFVVLQGKLDKTTAHDTPRSVSADELRVSPEYTLDDAYNKYLGVALFPPTLPFDRWLTTARTYLAFLASSLFEVAAACRTGAAPAVYSTPLATLPAIAVPPFVRYDAVAHTLSLTGLMTAGARNALLALSSDAAYQTALKTLYTASQGDVVQGTPTRIALACEYLGLSEAECVILTGADFAGVAPSSPPPLWAYYGFTPSTSAGWQTKIASVETFLQKTGILYDDLVALLDTRALNPTLSIMLLAAGTNPCDVSQTTIVDLSTSDHSLRDNPTLANAHRFIRLWKKLGWTIADLDRTLTALDAATIDQQFLIELAAIAQIKTALGLPLSAILAFWSDIDSDGRYSLYLSLFQNKAVRNPPDDNYRLVYVAPLAGPPTLDLPSPLFPNVAYDATAKKLALTGAQVMSDDEYAALKTMSADSGYLTAIAALHTNGTVPVALAALPKVTLPSWLNYNATSHQISYTGAMPDANRDQLNFSSDPAYQTAIDVLYRMRTLFGTELTPTPTPPGITDNVYQILAALRMSAQDLAVLRAYAGLADTTMRPITPLTLANLSTLVRYAFLAQSLNLSVNDLVSTIALLGTDPFVDEAPTSTLDFIRRQQAIQASPFSIAQLNYLYRNTVDPNAGVAPLPTDVALLLTTLQIGLASIARANAVVTDPKGALLAKTLATVLGASRTDAAMGLITGTGVYRAPLASLPAIALPSYMAYDATAQALSVTGPMTTAQKTIALGLSGNADYQAAVNSLHQQPIDFINANLATFLKPADAVTQLIENPAGLTVAERVAYVAARLMPYRRQVQSVSLIKQTLSDHLSLEPQLCDLLLNTILDSAVSPGTAHGIADFLALVGDGLSATYYSTPNWTGAPVATRIDAAVDFNWSFGLPDVPLATRPFSVQWTGFVMPQYAETYTFSVRAGDRVELNVDGVTVIPLSPDEMPIELSGSIALTAGQLYPVTLKWGNDTASAEVRLSWSSASTSKGAIPQTQLFSGTVLTSLAQVIDTHTRLFKANLLGSTFPLTVADVAYLYAHRADFASFDPNQALPPFNQWERLNAVVSLRAGLAGGDAGVLGIFGAAAASTTNTPGTLSGAVTDAILRATGWNQTDLEFLVSNAAFGLSDADFTNEIGLHGVGLVRLLACMTLIRRLGVSAQQLFAWSAFGSETAKDIQNTVKAKYDDATWVTVGKPLNDAVRDASRSALVAYILANAATWGMVAANDGAPITSADQLYEYFLIDVEMSPCMLTSRIVQASAAVQLFVQRALMNLELAVSPAAIDTEHWSWLQHFRFWQANRQVLVNPEDWLVGTLRDDKTPLFEDLENALLQGPLTADSVEQAYLKYLSGLNTIARLDIRASYWQLDPNAQPSPSGVPDATNDVLHVFGRTTTQPYTYYYRRLLRCSQYGRPGSAAIWTPWTQVTVDVDSGHIIPVVWDGRLYIFWPKFAVTADESAQGSVPFPQSTGDPNQTVSPALPHKDLAITLYWSEYRNGRWTSKHAADPWMFNFFNGFDNRPFDPSKFSFNTSFGGDDSLSVNIYWNRSGLQYLGQVTFSGCGSPPVVSAPTDPITLYTKGVSLNELIPPDYLSYDLVQDSYTKGLSLGVGSVPVAPAPSGPMSTGPWIPVLANTPTAYRLTFPHQYFASFGLEVPPPFPGSPDGEPFFYQDSDRVYFVTERFDGRTLNLRNPNWESPIYDRASLASAPAVNVDRTEIFIGDRVASRAPNARQRGPQKAPSVSDILFSNHFHPLCCTFIKEVNRYGLPAMLTRINQRLTNDGRVIEGFTLSPSPSSTPRLTAGSLYAHGQLYAPVATPNPGPAPANQTSFLYYNSASGFYYNSGTLTAFGLTDTPSNAGDAVIGRVDTDSSGRVTAVTSFTNTIWGTQFNEVYGPTPAVDLNYPLEEVDFSLTGAYSIYNWELFFYIPDLLASRFDQNHQYPEAENWWRVLFNPTTRSTDAIPQRYWQFLPFYQCSPWDLVNGQIVNIFYPPPSYGPPPSAMCGQGIADQIAAWQEDPFNPFLIARMRTVAFRMYVVMAYIRHHLSWGDYLFAQNTRESINEAMLHYVLAKELLGPRQEQIPARGTMQDYTYFELVTLFGLDDFSNALVLLESDFPYLASYGGSSGTGGPVLSMSTVVPYFCFPPNDALMALWDAVDDRLYKIRHCMNLEGQVEQLPLFAPPISPALLIAAAAAGVDLSSVLNATNAGTPFYRFSVMVRKALELCAEVRALGAALLAALEKSDGEALALLRATQEKTTLAAMQQMKQSAVDEASATLESLQTSLATAQARLTFYTTLINTGLSAFESSQVQQLGQASSMQQASQGAELVGAQLATLPNVSIGIAGVGGSPTCSLSFGGSELAAQANAVARGFGIAASLASYAANLAGINGGWDRRTQEWTFQQTIASSEVAEITNRIAAAKLGVQLAEQDQANLDVRIANAEAVESFLQDKYTKVQLYSWMVDQSSAVFFQCYQMAYDLATRAEAAFRFERGLTTSSYIQFGYWDSMKKGLLSGERLYADLKRMELAYLETDMREYEITKPISLVLLDPWALITLKTTGQCIVTLPEALFHHDYPGHYFLRIKTVSLTIPCVTGPYTSVNCTLTLLNSKIRIDNVASSKQDFVNEAHFLTNYAATQAIATSTAQNDAGMFEVSFHDDRYLPFEGGGAISTWQIDLPKDCNAFDLDSITDVVINLRYTSRYGGDILRDMARQAALLPPRPVQSFSGSTTPFAKPQVELQRLFSLRHEFPTEWYRLLNPPDASPDQSMAVALGGERFPYQYRGMVIKIARVEIVLLCSSAALQTAYTSGSPLALELGPPGSGSPSTATLNSAPGVLGGAPYGAIANPPAPAPASAGEPPSWVLRARGSVVQTMSAQFQHPVTSGSTTYYHLNPAAIDDILLVCHYTAA